MEKEKEKFDIMGEKMSFNEIVESVIKGIEKTDKWNATHKTQIIRVDIDWLIDFVRHHSGKFYPVLTGIESKKLTIQVLKAVRKRGYTRL